MEYFIEEEYPTKTKAYLAAPIFTMRDRMFNSWVADNLRIMCPNLDLYLAQENKSINDKTGNAGSAAIYHGDMTRLRESKLLIGIVSGDTPPIGTTTEIARFSALCDEDPTRRMCVLYDDCRDGALTYSDAKRDLMLMGAGESQFSYINLLLVGFIKKHGTLSNTTEKLFSNIMREYKVGFDKNDTRPGIYYIQDLRNNTYKLGATNHLFSMNAAIAAHQTRIDEDFLRIGFIEHCDIDNLQDRLKYYGKLCGLTTSQFQKPNKKQEVIV